MRASIRPGAIHIVDLALSLALGGDCLADVALVRSEPAVFGRVASDPTVSRLISKLAGDPGAALAAIATARAAARARAWQLAGTSGPDHGRDAKQPLIIDVDATLVTAHSEKENAKPTFKRGFGFHPLCAFVDHGAEGTGEPLAILLRPGNAGSNTAADHIRVIRDALNQLPDHQPGRRPGKKVLVRIDGAGGTHDLLNWLAKQRLGYVLDTAGSRTRGAPYANLRMQRQRSIALASFTVRHPHPGETRLHMSEMTLSTGYLMRAGESTADAGTARFRLNLLGAFFLRRNTSDIAIHRNEQRLLAILAIHGPMCKDEVSGRLWPDTPSPRAHACLRASISRLRRQVPLTKLFGDVITLQDTVIDYQDARQWADAVLRDGVKAEPAPQPAMLRELLPGWDDAWLTVPREQLHTAMLGALEVAAYRLASTNRMGLAASLAQTAVQLDPLRESSSRLLIEIHLREGNGAAAMLEYRRLSRNLRLELGSRPNPSLTSLIAEVGGQSVGGIYSRLPMSGFPDDFAQ